MDSKQRVMEAPGHKEGKIPFDLGGTPVSGIHAKPLERLREYYGLEKRPVAIIEPYQMLGRVDDDLREAMGIDTVPFWSPYTMFGCLGENFKEWRTPWEQDVYLRRGGKGI